LERGKLVAVAVLPRRTLSKQSLQGQVSVKHTPEICINHASSNSRLTAAQSHIARELSPDTIFFFLSSFDETTTKLYLHAEKLTETVLHLNLGHFVVVFFVLFDFFSPLMR
jgi:hypothetical protein